MLDRYIRSNLVFQLKQSRSLEREYYYELLAYVICTDHTYIVPFVSYRIPFNIHPIERYSWKYEVEKRHKITRQWTSTHLRHKLNFQQQTHKLSIHLKKNYDPLKSSCLHKTRAKLWLEPHPLPSPWATNFSLRFLYLKKDLFCGFGLVTGLRERYWCWDRYWYHCEGINGNKCCLQKKWQPKVPKQEWTNKQQRMDDMKKKRRKINK